MEAKHRDYEDMLVFMATLTKPDSDDLQNDPRGNSEAEASINSESVDYVTMESLAALEAFAPGLIENQCSGDKHVTMFKDEKRKEVWLLSKNDDHILPKATILGGFGSGHVGARKTDRVDCVPWTLPDGDKTYVQLTAPDDAESKSKPKVGTFYTVVKPLERAAAKKGTSLTLTSYSKN